jgi:hypothetical protein
MLLRSERIVLLDNQLNKEAEPIISPAKGQNRSVRSFGPWTFGWEDWDLGCHICVSSCFVFSSMLLQNRFEGRVDGPCETCALFVSIRMRAFFVLVTGVTG